MQLLTLLTLCAAMQAEPDAPVPADLILHGGVMHTVDPDRPRAEAVAVRDGTIAAVGDDATVLALRGPDTIVIDLAGRFAMPGFNDARVHFQEGAAFLEFNLMRVSSQEAFVTAVRDAVADLPEGEWILGGHWGADEAGAAFTPDVSAVESLTAKHPMFIRRCDDTVFAANRAALVAAGLDPGDPRVAEVEFRRDAEGRPTGIMTGPGVTRFFSRHAPHRFRLRRRESQTLAALAELARHGITSISDTSDSIQRRIFQRLFTAKLLTCRVHYRAPLADWRELMERGITINSGDAWVRYGAVHGGIDGNVSERTARLLEPYADDPTGRGTWQADMLDDYGNAAREKLLKLILNADQAGIQVSLHAAGDEAGRVALDMLERVNRTNGNRQRRLRLGPAQVLAPEDIVRFGSLNVVAEISPGQIADDMRRMETRLGEGRCRHALAYRSLADAGAVLVFGSGWPGTSLSAYPLDPLRALHGAVTRQTPAGTPADGWHPDQRLAIEDAIRAATSRPAFASFEEKIKGTITEGKLADVVVLSRNLLEIEPALLLDTEVELTIVNGKVVYEKP